MKTITIHSDDDYTVFGSGYTQTIGGEGATTLKMNPSTWTSTRVDIHKGIANYPAEMAEWASVKCLIDTKHITISPCNATEPSDINDATAVANTKKAEALKKQEIASNEKAKFKKKTLEDLTDQLYAEQAQSLLKKVKGENGKEE